MCETAERSEAVILPVKSCIFVGSGSSGEAAQTNGRA